MVEWASATERVAHTKTFIKGFDILEAGDGGGGPCGEVTAMDQLVFPYASYGLHESVIVAVRLAAHGSDAAVRRETGAVVRAERIARRIRSGATTGSRCVVVASP